MVSSRRSALIALGSNSFSGWGNISETVQKAMIRLLALSEGQSKGSNIYSTPAYPKGSGPDFRNAAVRLMTSLSPEKLLKELHEIEAAAGRTRQARWAPRTLDLDLIGMDDLILPDRDVHQIWRDLPMDRQMQEEPDQLILPHPRVQDRSFVLVPLADIAPDWVHPILGKSVRQMLSERPAEEVASILPSNPTSNS